MKITLHRGAGPAGGNCVELQSGKSRILLDYGVPPGTAPQQAALNIPGLYDKAQDPILALLISHTHQSHYGALLARPINPGIKIYMSEIMEDVARITAKMPRDGRPLPFGIHYFRRGSKFIIGRFVITPYLMDHDSAEAFAFLVESEGKRVIYTGHFRDHGGKASAFRQFIAANMGPVDALITEGVKAALDKGPTEQEVMAQVEARVKGNNGALYFACPAQDIGQLTELSQLAVKTRRYLVVDGYTALLLERVKNLAAKQGVELKSPALDTEYLRIVKSKATQRVYQMEEYAGIFRRMRPRMYGWEWVRNNLRKLIVPVRAGTQLWAEEEIKDFKGATLLYSAWDDYADEEGLPEALAWFRARGMADVPMPTTGHAYFCAIRKLVENKKPRCIIPVNTAQAQKFAATFGKKVRALKDGEALDLD